MTGRHLSRHAAVRSQQRAIPPLVIDWLLAYGARRPSYGAIRVSFDKRSRKELTSAVGKPIVSQLSKFFSVVIIVDGDTDKVITVEWLH